MSTVNRGVVRDKLLLYFDAANVNSFVSGSTKINNLVKDTLFGPVTGFPSYREENISGSLLNGPIYSTEVKGSIIFDGSNDYIDLSKHYFPGTIAALANLTIPLTLCSWIKTTNTQAGALAYVIKNPIFGELEDAGMPGVGVDNGYLTIAYYDYGINVSKKIQSNVFVADGNWHYVAFSLSPVDSRFNTGSWSVYLDGSKQVNQGNLPGFILDWIDGLGATRYGGFYNGSIAAFQIYKKNLSDSEVLQNYEVMKGRFGR